MHFKSAFWACAFVAASCGATSAAPFDCVIEPRSMIDLASTEKGLIIDVAVGRGDVVKEGQVLVQLDNTVQRLQVELREARAAADVEVRAAEARIEQRRKDLDRAQTLADRNVAAGTQVEAAQIELRLSELSLEQAILTRELSVVETDQARALLDRRVIRSPSDGIITAVEAAPGAYAAEQRTLVTLARIDPLHVEVFAPADYYERLAVGDRFEVQQAAPLSGRFEGRVTVIDKVFDAASGTFGIRLEIDNPDGTIPAGTRCLVDLDTPIN